MVDDLKSKLEETDADSKQEILDQIAELESKVVEKEEEKEEVDYRASHSAAGYVYIISNIGAFGEGVFKIGVTRRLDPLDRIAELGNASVPFRFDIHALIFSYDAYGLEKKLHSLFDSNRLNRINMRKEFFRADIEEIEEVLKEYKNLTIDFNKFAEADEYRQSLLQ